MAQIHMLKTWPQVFMHTISGEKSFEFRKNDRNFKVGDCLILREYRPNSDDYTGRIFVAKVDYVLQGGVFEIPDGYCIMSIIPWKED